MHFSKPGKYSIINKSSTFETFFHPYLKPQTFTSFLFIIHNYIIHIFSTIKILDVFSRKTGIPVKTRKITCLNDVSSHSSLELHSSYEMLFSGTSSGALTCDCSSSSSDEMLSRTDAVLWWVFFGYSMQWILGTLQIALSLSDSTA